MYKYIWVYSLSRTSSSPPLSSAGFAGILSILDIFAIYCIGHSLWTNSAQAEQIKIIIESPGSVDT